MTSLENFSVSNNSSSSSEHLQSLIRERTSAPTIDISSQNVQITAECITNNSESSTDLSTHSATVSEGIIQKSANWDHISQLDKKLGNNEERELVTANTRGNLFKSGRTPRETQMMEALSVPLHLEKSARMMKMMGYQGGPLGVRGEGITEPIKPALDRMNGAGLGYERDTRIPNRDTRIPNRDKRIPNRDTRVPNQRSKNIGKKVHSSYWNPLQIGKPPSTKGYSFKLLLLRAAIKLMTSEVDQVLIPYNQRHKKKKYFVKCFFDTVNEGCNFDFELEEAVYLADTLKVAMENSPWDIEGFETIDRKILLKKVPANHERRSKKSNLAPRHAITPQNEPETTQDSDNDNSIVYITDKRLNYYVNNVTFPNVDGYPQSCTFSLAFRLILLDEILKFSKSDNTSIAIDLGVKVDKDEFNFVLKLNRQQENHNFLTKMENDTFGDISFVMFSQNLFLDIDYGSQRRLIVRKLPDTPEHKRMTRKRLKESYQKNNDSDPKNVTSNEIVTTANKDVTTANKDVTTANKDVTTANKDVTTANKDVTTANKDVTTANKDVTIVNENVTTANEEIEPITTIVS